MRYFCCFSVISVPEQVADRLEPSDDSSGPSYVDYSERRSLPISIPDYHTVNQNGEKFVVSSVAFHNMDILITFFLKTYGQRKRFCTLLAHQQAAKAHIHKVWM